MNVRLQDLRHQPHTSVSQIGCFIRCPRQHFHRYINRTPAAFRSVALAFGTAWHEAVGHILMNGTAEEPVPVEEAHSVFCFGVDQQLASDMVPVLFEDEETEDDLKNKARQMLAVFIEKFPLPDEVLGIEVPFSVELEDPRTGDVLPSPLIGAIDAIGVYNGRPTLIELKSGKKRWNADLLELDSQLTAYRIGARVHDMEDPVLRLAVTTKAKTPDVQVEDLVRHDRDERELIELIADVHHAIEAGVDYRIRGWQCKTCPYVAECSP